MSALNVVVSNNGRCFGFCNHRDGYGSSSGSDDERHQMVLALSSPYQQHQEGTHLKTEDRERKKDLDALLCQAMDNLSLEEREKQQGILHGVDQTVEDERSVDRTLEDLDKQLQSIKHNSMYEVAERINPDYVSARAFRVMFLRANSYDPKASADQMLKFFDSKYQLFGIEKLVEDITLADLNENDLAFLKSGCIQLAGRDKSNRQVIAYFAGALGDNLQAFLRAQYFVLMRALQDETTQCRGIITAWMAVSDLKMDKGIFLVEGFKHVCAIPHKKQAIHICVDDMRQFIMGQVLIGVKAATNEMGIRLRVHYGSLIECQYQLSNFGINPQSIPLDPSNGGIDTDNHLLWLQSVTMKDNLSQSLQPTSTPVNDGIITPNPADVIFAGGKIMNHAGNQKFHLMIKSYAQAYDNEQDVGKKRIITNAVIEEIHKSGGRFLQRDKIKQTWAEVPPVTLRKKIMQTFRNRRSKAEAASKRKAAAAGAKDSLQGTLIADEPRLNDVIFNKSPRNPGRELLQRLIKDHYEEYESLGRGMKIGLVETIMQTIIASGGRFLHPGDEPGQWLELSNDYVRERISKSFRNYRRIQNKKK